jgi:hypothetical protein
MGSGGIDQFVSERDNWRIFRDFRQGMRFPENLLANSPSARPHRRATELYLRLIFINHLNSYTFNK